MKHAGTCRNRFCTNALDESIKGKAAGACRTCAMIIDESIKGKYAGTCRICGKELYARYEGEYSSGVESWYVYDGCFCGPEADSEDGAIELYNKLIGETGYDENDLVLAPGNTMLVYCPYCEEGYLHHDQIEVYQRNEEDSMQGTFVSVRSLGYRAPTPSLYPAPGMEANPSGRRDGLRILFWCENCKETPSFVLYQHKGCTFIGWEK